VPRSRQRRNADPDHGEAINTGPREKTPFWRPRRADSRLVAAKTRNVDLLVGVRAPTLRDGALVEHAELGRLEIERHLADLVEEDRCRRGLFSERAAADP